MQASHFRVQPVARQQEEIRLLRHRHLEDSHRRAVGRFQQQRAQNGPGPP